MTQAGKKTDARVIIIGGGMAGCSAAYHLAALGVNDVLLLERSELSSGTTWHSTGNMETYRDDPLIFAMVRYAVESFARLQAESGQTIGWRNVGRVMYTDRAERLEQFRTLPELGRTRGIELELLAPADLKKRLPILDTQHLLGGVWIPSDGRVNPTEVVTAYAKVARARGISILEHVEVQQVLLRDGAVRGVATNQGEFACDCVIIAAGLWSGAIANSAGVRLPLYALEHQYIISRPIPDLDRNMPLFLSYDDQLYGREEVGGLIVGSLDDNALAIAAADLPATFSFGLLPDRWEQFEPYMITAMRRFPILRTTQIKMQVNGPESFTPDGQMLLGPVPGVDGLFSACGFNSNGIALAPAAGKFIAEWLIEGSPSLDVTPLDVRRFAPVQTTPAYMRERVTEVPGYSCRIHHPGDDYSTARNVRRSPIHEELAAAGARFASVAGWERPLWIETQRGAAWTDLVASETQAAAAGALVVDRSTDAKIVLVGDKVDSWLRAHISLSLRQAHASIVAAFRGPRGGIEALGRVVPDADNWLLMIGPEQETRLQEWLRKAFIPKGVAMIDVTEAWALLEFAGPKREEVLATLAAECSFQSSDVAKGLSWTNPATIREIKDPAHASSLLLIPAHEARRVWRALLKAGASAGLHLGGHYAQEALRISRGIPRFGQEASPAIQASELFGIESDQRLTHQGLAAFSSDCATFGFGEREAIVAGDRVVGEVTSRACLPAWTETRVLARMLPQVPHDSSLELVAYGRRWPLTRRQTFWQQLHRLR